MVEVQYHPADVSRPPRFFFLREEMVKVYVVACVLLLAILGAGFPMVPRAISGLVVWLKVKRLEGEREACSKHRQVLEAELAGLRSRVREAGQQLRRAALVLGTEPKEWENLPLDEGLSRAAAELVAEAERLQAWAEEHRELVASLPAVSPVGSARFELSSPFGGRVSPFTGTMEFHKGIDLAAEEGLPVRATGKGVVLFAGRAGMDNPSWARLGNAVVLQHHNLYLTIYAHLRRVLVKEGEIVARGHVVGEVGSTGWSTAPHLHYEVRKLGSADNAVPVDPRFFMLDYPWWEKDRAVGGEASSPLDLLPRENERLPWLKTKRYRR